MKFPLVGESIPKEENTIYLSCASKLKLEDEHGVVFGTGMVLRIPDRKPLPLQRLATPTATLKLQADYDAMYTGLDALTGMSHQPYDKLIIVSNNSEAVSLLREENVDVLNKEHWRTLAKRDTICNVLATFPYTVEVYARSKFFYKDLRIAHKLADTIPGF